METTYYIGIDISKETLDMCVMKNAQLLDHSQVPNSLQGLREFLKKLRKQSGFKLSNAIFCMEHTGIYNNIVLQFLTGQKVRIVLESAINIIKSQGLQRGKNDKIDAHRIALYAFKNRDFLKLWEPPRDVITKLKYFVALRGRLLNAYKILHAAIKEDTKFVDKNLLKEMNTLCDKSINAIKKEIQEVNQRISNIIKKDEHLDHLFNLIKSVDSVGNVTATEIILATNEFKAFTDPKKFACYSGVVPFEHSSGKSIRGKTRVSNFANKNVKGILHMAALSAITMKGEMRDYFIRKTESGKNKMSVINAVRNKIIHRIFACVNQNRPYKKNYLDLFA